MDSKKEEVKKDEPKKEQKWFVVDSNGAGCGEIGAPDKASAMKLAQQKFNRQIREVLPLKG